MLEDVARLARAVPELRIVIDHLPFDAPAGLALAALREYSRVYAKVSGRLPLRRVSMALARVRARPADLRFELAGERTGGAICAIFSTVQSYFAAKGNVALRKFLWDNAVTAYRFRTFS